VGHAAEEVLADVGGTGEGEDLAVADYLDDDAILDDVLVRQDVRDLGGRGGLAKSVCV
jgi:hypothetical protein